MRRRDLLAIAATQQVREMQEGARFANAHFSALRTNFSHSRSVEWYGYLNSSEPFEYVYAENDVANNNKNIAINTEKSILRVIYNGKAIITKSITSGYYHIVAVLNGEKMTAYLNGVAGATTIVTPPTTAPVRVLVGAFNTSMLHPFKGVSGHIREFNYALSPQQIAALYNNGKPEEYLLPTAEKITFDGYRDYTGQVVSYTWDDVHKEYYYYPNCNDKALMPKNTWWECVVELSNYVDGNPSVYLGGDIVPKIDLPLVNGIYTSILRSNGIYNTVGMYGGYRDTSRHLTMTLISVRQVGCIAEYLPQNLVTTHDGDMTDKTPIAWLDSAKQLPLNDEYLPPLLQGVGGYDLTALGTPEIVEKAR